MWLSLEILLSSFALGLFIFHRQRSPHRYERKRKSDDLSAINKSDHRRQIAWWTLWFFAFLCFAIPTLYEIYWYGLQGTIRLLLMVWWGLDLKMASSSLWNDSKTDDPQRYAVEGQSLIFKHQESRSEQRVRWQRSWLSVFLQASCVVAISQEGRSARPSYSTVQPPGHWPTLQGGGCVRSTIPVVSLRSTTGYKLLSLQNIAEQQRTHNRYSMNNRARLLLFASSIPARQE
jgi:hypothetical protein